MGIQRLTGPVPFDSFVGSGCTEPDETCIVRAIVYEDGADIPPLARALVAAWTERGMRVAGLIEDHISRQNRDRCDMVLHELVTGERIVISEYRGKHSRGCRLDASALLRATEMVRQSLAAADILILNKFGKIECNGGGLRSLIAEAIDHFMPIVIFVPRRNLDPWHGFVGPMALQRDFAELPMDGAAASQIIWPQPLLIYHNRASARSAARRSGR